MNVSNIHKQGMTSSTALHNLMVEGYRFCRSDGEPFDSSVMTFVPPDPTGAKTNPPYATIFKPTTYENQDEDDVIELYHECNNCAAIDSDLKKPAATKRFVLAHRCEPTWNTLSDQQKDVIENIEKEVETYRKEGIFCRSVIMEGLGGCGKTRLMAYVINHSPNNTHVFYLTKQNKRLQDFLYDELDKGELVPPRPVVDMSKCASRDFGELSDFSGGRYACSVEKLVYNVASRKEARETNTRKAVQWKMNIPDKLFFNDSVKTNTSNVVVFLDEYTMISPPLLHKMLHCIEILFSAPTVLIMGGDRFQLGPIDWDVRSDRNYKDKCGEKAPENAATKNNYYYTSDVREELKRILKQEPFEYRMVGSQRCRDDPQLAAMVVYLRNACQKRTSVKAIERRLVAFGRSRGIHLFRYDEFRQGCKTGRLTFKTGDNRSENEDNLAEDETTGTAVDDENDEDRHIGDDGLRDTSTIDVDWASPPTVDMTPFIKFYTELYEDIYLGYTEGSLHDLRLPSFVYEKASKFACNSFPCFMVKKNDKCNLLSDTFLKTLYNGVYAELNKTYAEERVEGSGVEAKRLKLSSQKRHLDIKSFLEKLCVSISVSDHNPVQQTMMVGVPYRMTDTLKSASVPVVSNGELVLLTAIEFEKNLAVTGVFLKTLQRKSDHFLLVRSGLTQNRLNETPGKKRSTTFYNSGGNSRNADFTYMLPMVPMICENIYQMQGNTIVSDCFVDLLSTKRDDIYVAVSRFQKTASIKGIIMSR